MVQADSHYALITAQLCSGSGDGRRDLFMIINYDQEVLVYECEAKKTIWIKAF